MKRPTLSRLKKSLFACVCASNLMLATTHAQQVKTVFYILLENRNFTSNGDLTDGSLIMGNSAAPYLNSLITPNKRGVHAGLLL